VTRCSYVGTDAGIYVKSGIGRGGLVHDIFVDHIAMKDITNAAIGFDPYYVNRPASAGKVPAPAAPRGDPSLVPEFTGFLIRDIQCLGAATAISLAGLPQQATHGITIENAMITATKGVHLTDAADITLKHVTIHTPEVPAMTETRTTNVKTID
jgi:polygalacturonase